MLGLVEAVGTDLDLVTNLLADTFAAVDYQSKPYIRLATLLRALPEYSSLPGLSGPLGFYTDKLMTLGMTSLSATLPKKKPVPHRHPADARARTGMTRPCGSNIASDCRTATAGCSRSLPHSAQFRTPKHIRPGLESQDRFRARARIAPLARSTTRNSGSEFSPRRSRLRSPRRAHAPATGCSKIPSGHNTPSTYSGVSPLLA